jgi:uncharacterized protein
MHTAFSFSRALVVLWAAVALSLSARSAWADLGSASAAYSKGEFAVAFQQFKELAELGQPTAQYNLAVMYARGEGIGLSNTNAHAWASLAAAGGQEAAAALRDGLEPELSPTSLKVSSEIQEKFSRPALDARLMPRLLQGREYENRDPVRKSKLFMPAYPAGAQAKGVQGEAYVEFVVAPDGHPRIPRILYAVPAGYFEEAVRDSIMRSVYLPARTNGQPIATTITIFYNFKMNLSIGAYDGLEKRVQDVLAKAEAGDPRSQVLYGMMIAGLPQLKQTYDRALPWFLKAAQAGSPYAQYQIGTGLLQGRGCQCDTGKGEIWLEKAAQADQSDAQVSLAEYLLKGNPNSEGIAGAIVWLERSAKQGNSYAKLRLSAILAARSSKSLSDSTRALDLVDTLEHEFKRDPSFWEIRAAANASRGDFRAATKAQAQAINEAKRLDWDLTALNQRQSVYVSGQAWSGDLLAF